MPQFKKYPIYSVYSRHNQDASRATASAYNTEARRLEKEAKRLNNDALKREAKEEFEWEKFVENTAITTEDADPAYRKEAADYHKAIFDRLTWIESVPFGGMLLRLFRSDVFIVPRLSDDKCYCAQTYPLDWDTDQGFAVGKGDTYIWFNPNKDFTDDVLFHELTHAYRYSVGRFNRIAMADNEYNTEEFYAHQMQNTYRSYKRLKLEFSYNNTVASHPDPWGTKREIYDHFLSHDDFTKVLKQFLAADDFARTIARLNYPDYNPFRDYPSLQKQVDQINRMMGK